MESEREDFSEIFNQYYPRLCSFLEWLLGSSSLAQDIAQESLLRLYRYGCQRVAASEIRYWLFHVARNLAYNELKRRKRQEKLREILPFFFRTHAPDPEEQLAREETSDQLMKLVALLPADQRAALLLREQEEMSYREIAQLLRVSESKIKIDIFRARNFLRERWPAQQTHAEPRKQQRS